MRKQTESQSSRTGSKFESHPDYLHVRPSIHYWYTQHLTRSGVEIDKPDEYASAICKSGEQDEAVDAWLDALQEQAVRDEELDRAEGWID